MRRRLALQADAHADDVLLAVGAGRIADDPLVVVAGDDRGVAVQCVVDGREPADRGVVAVDADEVLGLTLAPASMRSRG